MPSVFFISMMSASPWGGSEELWYRTALLAAKKGWRTACAVYHWKEKENRLAPLLEAGCSIHYLPNKGRRKKNLLDRIQNKISKARVKKIIHHLPVDEYDLVVVNMGAFEITMPAWRNLSSRLSRYIVLYHNYKEGEVFSGEKKEAIANLANGAQLNLFASRRIREVLAEGSNIIVPRHDILLNPITFDKPTQATAFPALDQGNYRFVMLAALEVNRKAQDQLIKALSSSKWKARNWTLHLYGEGKDRSMLENLIRSLGLEEKVFLEGHSSDVKQVLEKSHVLLQLTHQDAMPLSVVEAMAIGRPVVASSIGDMPDWINENENGWISTDASSTSIDLTLEKAWNARDRWDEMGRNAFEKFNQKFPSSVEEQLLSKMEASLKKA